MADIDGIQKLVAARNLLKSSLEESIDFASSLEGAARRMSVIDKRLSCLEAEIVSHPMQKNGTFVGIRDQIDRAISPAMAVLKVYDTSQELERSILSFPHPISSNLSVYYLLVKQLEEAIKFLADNCGLTIQWLQDILQFLDENANVVCIDFYSSNVKKCLRILKELQITEKRACLNGGPLFAAISNLEAEFKQLLRENCIPVDLGFFSTFIGEKPCIAPSPLPVSVIQRLQATIARLHANNRLEKCLSLYVEARTTSARRGLQPLNLSYLEKEITEVDDVQDIEGDINQWRKHLELAVKHAFEVEYKLCSEVFEKIGPDAVMDCFAKIAVKSGILTFLKFGRKVTECKNDAIKLLKLLDIFSVLHNLRGDFNRLFGGEACVEIQTMTRDLIKRVVNGAYDIFQELPIQVELQRQNSPPLDGNVPKLLRFVTDYCNRLAGDEYKSSLSEVLLIYKTWKQEEYQEGVVTVQIYYIMKEVGLNLDSWSKSYPIPALSYLFMMNNHCHFSNLKGTSLGGLMGDSWLKSHEQHKDYFMTLYLRETWGRTFAILSQEGNGNSFIKKRLKAFTLAFDGMILKQSSWVVPNDDLKLKMSKLVVQGFVPVYNDFLQNHGFLSEEDGKYAKYTIQDLEIRLKGLNSLFQPRLRKLGSTKQSHHLIGRIKSIVTDNFHFTLLAV